MSLQGGATAEEQAYLRTLAADMRHVAEIGFNEGHSASALLSANPVIRVVSFELAEHYDLQLAKYRVDAEFPGRHELVTGDSRVTVPRWVGAPFDLMFVDGDHTYEAVTEDLRNALAVIRPGGLVMVDDLTPWKPWGTGPTMAWRELTGSGAVVQIDLRRDGEPIPEIPARGEPGARVWAVAAVSGANDRTTY